MNQLILGEFKIKHFTAVLYYLMLSVKMDHTGFQTNIGEGKVGKGMKTYLFLLLVMVIFSSNILVGKEINELPPFTIAFFRYLVAFLVILPIGLRSFNANKQIWKKEWKAILGLALTGIAFFNVMVYASLQYTTASNVAIIEATTPVFTIALALLFLREDNLAIYQWIGVAVSLMGAIWVITKGSLELLLTLNFNTGDLIMIGAVIVWAIYSILLKKHNKKFPVYGGLLVMFAIAVVSLFPFALWEWMSSSPTVSGNQVISLIYLGIFPSVIALILWNKAVEELGPSRSSIFLNFLPVFTMVGAALFLGEQIQLAQIIGAMFVIGGVFLTTRKTRTQRAGITMEKNTR